MLTRNDRRYSAALHACRVSHSTHGSDYKAEFVVAYITVCMIN